MPSAPPNTAPNSRLAAAAKDFPEIYQPGDHAVIVMSGESASVALAAGFIPLQLNGRHIAPLLQHAPALANRFDRITVAGDKTLAEAVRGALADEPVRIATVPPIESLSHPEARHVIDGAWPNEVAAGLNSASGSELSLAAGPEFQGIEVMTPPEPIHASGLIPSAAEVEVTEALAGLLFEGQPLTSRGTAGHVARLRGSDALYDVDTGTWLAWDRYSYIRDPDQTRVERLVGGVVTDLWQSFSGMVAGTNRPCPADAAAIMRYLDRAAANRELAEAVKHLGREEPFRVGAFDLNAKAHLLACPNGVVDLRTGDLRPGRRQDRITQRTRVEYDPTAEAPEFLRFVSDICDHPDGTPDPELVEYLQRLLGYCITGEIDAEVFVIFSGVGANGKSKLLEIVADSLGSDLSYKAKFSSFVAAKRDRIRDDLAKMATQHTRLAFASEGNTDDELDAALLKELSGESELAHRTLYKEEVRLPNRMKVILSTNHMPRADSGPAMQRRMVVIPFRQNYRPEHEMQLGDRLRDDDLPKRIRSNEGPGVLRWLVEGAVKWYAAGGGKAGLGRCASSEHETAEVLQGLNSVAEFVSQACVFAGPDDKDRVRCRIKVTDLHDAFRNYSMGADVSLGSFTEQVMQCAEVRAHRVEQKRATVRDRKTNKRTTAQAFLGLSLPSTEGVS